MRHARARELMDRSFSEALSVDLLKELRAHLDDCERCRARYDRLARVGAASRAVARGEEGVSPELDLARLERLSHEFFELHHRPARSAKRPLFSFVPTWGFAGAAALVLVVVGIAILRAPAPDQQLYARGGDAGGLAAAGAELRFFSLDVDGAVRDLGQESERGTPRLAAGAPIKFSYTNLDPAIGHLAVVALDREGTLTWLLPAHGGSVALLHGTSDELLPGEAQLGAPWGDGQVRLFALFSEQPLDRGAVERAAGALSDGGDPTSADRIPGLGGVRQQTLLLAVAGAPEEDEDAGGAR